MDKFCETTEKIEDKLEELELCEVKDSQAKDTAENQEELNCIREELTFEQESLKKSVSDFVNEVNSLREISLTTSTAFEKLGEKLRSRLELLRNKSRSVEK